ncbi:MAG: YHS domain-containing protein, partial [Candidatus Thermoplasmatota archaeon]
MASNSLVTVKLHVRGMTCASCARGIEGALRDLDGVAFAGVNQADGTVLVKYDPARLNVEKILAVIRGMGYEAFESAPAVPQIPSDAGDESIAIDPICGMSVYRATGVRRILSGSTYYFCSEACAAAFQKSAEGPDHTIGKKAMHREMPQEAEIAEKYVAIDPICGMRVDKRRSITRVIGGRSYYFCTEACARSFEDPERELREMKKRVSIAVGGVVLLGVLRLAIFLGLAAGVTVVTWVPFDFLPWFTGGVWLFILTTPIIFIGGKGFFVGAAKALKYRSANMDLLITIGTLAAYLYSAVIVLDQFVASVDILPGVEGEVYFDVAAVIIAFVLLGKYMEDVLKRRSSAAVRKLLDLKPKMASVIRGGNEVEIP